MSTKATKTAFKDREFWNHPLALVSMVLVLFALVGTVRWWNGAQLPDLLFEALFVVVLTSVGLLKAIYPRVDRAIEKGFAYYFLGTLLLLVLLAPMSFALWVSRWALTDLSEAGRAAFSVLATVLWALTLCTVAYRRWRTWILDRLAALGWFLPLIFLFNYAMVSVILFGAISVVWFCGAENACKLASAPETSVTLDTFLDLYLWHLLDSIPMLEVPETLPWPKPLDYGASPTLLGALLVLFKLTVIVPGIAAFTSYWERRPTAQASA